MSIRKLIKKIILKGSMHSNYIKNFYANNAYIRMPVGLTIINFIFQRILRINGDVTLPVHFTSKINAFNKIKYTNDKSTILSFAVSGNCYIQATNGIKLGANFLMAPGVKLISSNHDFIDHDQPIYMKPIEIGNNVWLGANSIVLPGIVLADGVIVGAGSVVTKSFTTKNSILAGNPAKLIKLY